MHTDIIIQHQISWDKTMKSVPQRLWARMESAQGFLKASAPSYVNLFSLQGCQILTFCHILWDRILTLKIRPSVTKSHRDLNWLCETLLFTCYLAHVSLAQARRRMHVRRRRTWRRITQKQMSFMIRNRKFNFNNEVVTVRGMRFTTLQIGSRRTLSSSGTLTFWLADFISSGYSSCWDYYSILKIVITIIPTRNVSVTQSTFGFLTVQTMIDYDDSSKPSECTKPPFPSQSGMRVWYQNKRHTRVFRPKPSIPLYDSSTNIYAFMQDKNKLWLNCANPSVPHYGFKCLSYYRFVFKAYIQFRRFQDQTSGPPQAKLTPHASHNITLSWHLY